MDKLAGTYIFEYVGHIDELALYLNSTVGNPISEIDNTGVDDVVVEKIQSLFEIRDCIFVLVTTQYIGGNP